MADYVLSVKVTGDAKDFEKTMQKAGATFQTLEKTYSKSGLQNLSSKLQSVGSSMQSVGSAITSRVTKPALVAGGALAGMTLAKGWSRMTQLDDARVKLRAIGTSATDVEKITKAAGNAVDGTAYSMADAMTTAAAAAAALGDNAGDKMDRYLRNVANASALAGVGMTEMGTIFNKVATNGKMTAEELNQLADRGVPIMQLLSKATGKSMDEVREAMANGEIGIEELQAAFETLGPHVARDMGSETITGSIANIGAAIGRVGEAFLGSTDDVKSFAGQAHAVLEDFRTWISETVKPVAEQWGKVFGQVFGQVVNFLRTGSVEWEAMGGKASGVFQKIQPLLSVIRTLGKWFMDLSPKGKMAFAGIVLGIGPAIKMMGTIVGTAGKVIGIFNKFSKAGKAVDTLGGSAMTTGAKVSSMGLNFLAAGGAVALLGAGILAAGLGFKFMAQAAIELANSGGLAIGIFAGMVIALGGLIAVMALAGPALTAGAVGMLAFGAAILMASAGVALVCASIALLITALGNASSGISQIIGAVTGTIRTAGAVVIGILNTVRGIIITFAMSAMAVFRTFGTVVTSVLRTAGAVISSVLGSIGSLFMTAGMTITMVMNSISAVVGSVLGAISGLFQSFGVTVSTIMNSISNVITAVGTAISGILNSVAGVFRSMGSAALMAGLGVRNMAAGIRSLVKLKLGDLIATLGATASGLRKIGNSGTGLASVSNGMARIVSSSRTTGVAMNTLARTTTTLSSTMSRFKATASSSFSAAASSAGRFRSATVSAFNSATSALNKFVSATSKIKNIKGKVTIDTASVTKAQATVTKAASTIKSKISSITGKVTISAKVPKFSVSWTSSSKGGTTAYIPKITKYYAKGAIFSRPTLLNGNSVVGEAGPEAVAPISTLQKYVIDAVSAANSYSVTQDEIREAVRDGVRELLPAIEAGLVEAVEGMGINVDSREFGRVVRRVIPT